MWPYDTRERGWRGTKVVTLLFRRVGTVFLICFVASPVLHELGHLLAAWLVNGEVERVTLLPVPCVEVRLDPERGFACTAVCFGGIALPMLVSLLPARGTSARLSRLALRLMVLVAALASVAGCIGVRRGTSDEASDIASLLTRTEAGYFTAMTVSLVFLCLSVLLLIRAGPADILRCAGE